MNMEWLEIPWLPEDLVFPSGVPMPEMINGEVHLPESPGLGVNTGLHLK
jgi:L-alanine-DL-glutamate epimerase-like enolase superfamily enzyme